MISAAETVARLRLSRSENVGPITYRQLIARFGSAEAALAALPDLAARGGKRQIALYPNAKAQDEVRAIEKAGAFLLFAGVAPYPSLLARIEDAPPVLIAKGHATLFDKKAVAMVGARNASAAGIRFAREIALGLGDSGLCIVSGLARGIDAAAHEGALASSGGSTIACVAGGVDIHYPPENSALYDRIGSEGILVSEQPLGTVPQGRHFPRRNRIISGLSLGTIVVEAALKSGSLITARVAGEQGREVMAVPGSPADPRAQGCNQLIREGATLVQSVNDILEALSGLSQGAREPVQDFLPVPASPTEASDSERRALEQLLGPTPVPVDELVRLSGLAPGVVQLIVLEMELAGNLVRHAGGRVSLA